MQPSSSRASRTPQGLLNFKKTQSPKYFSVSLILSLVAIATTALASTVSPGGSLRQLLLGPKLVEGIEGFSHPAAANSSLISATTSAQSSALSVERKGHTATLLSDGRVLIVGGENSSGLTNQNEIFDPASSTFSLTGSLSAARANHTATRLDDGRVLIAGGRGAVGALTTTEIFDPATGTSASGPAMGVARAGHSATLFADGRILMSGGDESGSAEIFDPSTGAFTAVGAQMLSARSMHSSALLLDGRVLLVGGRDTNGNDLLTGEIFDSTTSSFSEVAGSLIVPHVMPLLRVLFDGKVQIIGGNSDKSMEIYDPVYEGFGAYAHVIPETDTCAGLSAQILASQTRTALFHNGQADPLFDRSGQTITEMNGQALVAGGANSSGVFLNSFAVVGSTAASVTTDKLDYAPGETVNIIGRNFQPGETVRLKIHEDPHTDQERGLDVVADADGNFTGTYLVMDYDLNMKFLLGARGLTSGRTAQTSFTDGIVSLSILSPTSGSPANITTLPNTVNVQFNYRTNGSGSSLSSTVNIRSGATIVGQTLGGVVRANGAGGATVTFAVNLPAGTANGSYAVEVILTDPGTGNPPTATDIETNAVSVNAPVPTTLSLSAPSPSSMPYGSGNPVTFAATLQRQFGAAAVAGATIDFRVDGGSVGTAATNASGVATISTYDPSALSTGPHSVQAVFAGQVIAGTTYVGSSSLSQTLTITPASTTTTIDSDNPDPSAVGETVTVAYSVAVVAPGGGTPSGNVVVNASSGESCSGSVAAAQCTIVFGSVGPQTLTATLIPSSPFYSGSTSAANSHVVNKAVTALSVSAASGTYGGTVDLSATLTRSSSPSGALSGKTISFTLNGIAVGSAITNASGVATILGASLAGINAGPYPTGVGASFAEDTNYLSSTATNSLNVAKADAICNVRGYTGTYDAAAHSASGSCSGVDAGGAAIGTSLSLGASFTNVPGGTANWSFTGGDNYNDQTGTAAIVIDKADATIVVNGYTGIYDGAAHGATGSATGVLSEALAGLDLGASFTNVPGGTANWTFTDVTGNYNNATGTAAIVISQASSTVTVNCPGTPQTYSGGPQTPCTAEATGAGMGPIDVTSSLIYSNNMNVGTATADGSWPGDLNHTGNTGSSSFEIAKAALDILAVTNTKLYDADNTAAAIPTVSGLQGSDTVTGLVQTYDNKNAGSGKTLSVSTYTINDGNGGNNYDVHTFTNNTGVINKAPLNITAASNTKVYDAGVTAAAIPTVSGLQGTDSVTGLSETYDTKHKGTGKTLSVSAYTVNDDNGGDNYEVHTFTNSTGVINAAPLTIAAVTNTKIYDGTTSAAAIPTVAGIQGTDSVTDLAESYDTKHAGTSKVLSVSSYTVNDGNAGANYNVTTSTNSTGIINKLTITVTAVTNTKAYDGNTSSSGTPTVTTGNIAAGDTANFTQTFDTPLVGTGKTLTPAGTVNDGNGGDNYGVSFVNVNTGVITTIYCFEGFLSPIGGSVETFNGGSFADPLRAFKLGSTIPVKFSIKSLSGSVCGAPITTGIHTLQTIRYSNSTTPDTPIDATPTDSATSGNQFRLTDSQWHFNLSTKGGAFTQGIWLLQATLQDGSIHTVWIAIKK